MKQPELLITKRRMKLYGFMVKFTVRNHRAPTIHEMREYYWSHEDNDSMLLNDLKALYQQGFVDHPVHGVYVVKVEE